VIGALHAQIVYDWCLTCTVCFTVTGVIFGCITVAVVPDCSFTVTGVIIGCITVAVVPDWYLTVTGVIIGSITVTVVPDWFFTVTGSCDCSHTAR